jgi:hypothetical protein
VKKERPSFSSEAQLCEAFSEEMVKQGWVPYPETDGWDILLVGHGLQAGVEAKLKPSIGVLAQLSTRLDGRGAGPSYAVLLVPYSTGDFEVLATALGAVVYQPRLSRFPPWRGEKTAELGWPDLLNALQYAPALTFDRPAWVPPVAPDVVAGLPAPVRLTPWKIAALRLVARLELRGWVTVEDFREVGLNTSRWYHHWVEPSGTDRPQRWVRRAGVSLADEQHPRAFATLMERERELLAAPPLRVTTGAYVALPLLDHLQEIEENPCP